MKTEKIRFEDWGTGYYIITASGRVLGRMFRDMSGWYFVDDPESDAYSFAARRLNDAKRYIREHFAKGAAFALLLALPLTTHAAPIASAPGPSCAYSTPTEDEGTVYAVCPDGTAYYLDRDGQPFENAAGVPVRPPGWVRLA